MTLFGDAMHKWVNIVSMFDSLFRKVFFVYILKCAVNHMLSTCNSVVDVLSSFVSSLYILTHAMLNKLRCHAHF